MWDYYMSTTEIIIPPPKKTSTVTTSYNHLQSELWAQKTLKKVTNLNSKGKRKALNVY